jgi:hypothetical protein
MGLRKYGSLLFATRLVVIAYGYLGYQRSRRAPPERTANPNSKEQVIGELTEGMPRMDDITADG